MSGDSAPELDSEGETSSYDGAPPVEVDDDKKRTADNMSTHPEEENLPPCKMVKKVTWQDLIEGAKKDAEAAREATPTPVEADDSNVGDRTVTQTSMLTVCGAAASVHMLPNNELKSKFMEVEKWTRYLPLEGRRSLYMEVKSALYAVLTEMNSTGLITDGSDREQAMMATIDRVLTMYMIAGYVYDALECAAKTIPMNEFDDQEIEIVNRVIMEDYELRKEMKSWLSPIANYVKKEMPFAEPDRQERIKHKLQGILLISERPKMYYENALGMRHLIQEEHDLGMVQVQMTLRGISKDIAEMHELICKRGMAKKGSTAVVDTACAPYHIVSNRSCLTRAIATKTKLKTVSGISEVASLKGKVIIAIRSEEGSLVPTYAGTGLYIPGRTQNNIYSVSQGKKNGIKLYSKDGNGFYLASGKGIAHVNESPITDLLHTEGFLTLEVMADLYANEAEGSTEKLTSDFEEKWMALHGRLKNTDQRFEMYGFEQPHPITPSNKSYEERPASLQRQPKRSYNERSGKARRLSFEDQLLNQPIHDQAHLMEEINWKDYHGNDLLPLLDGSDYDTVLNVLDGAKNGDTDPMEGSEHSEQWSEHCEGDGEHYEWEDEYNDEESEHSEEEYARSEDENM